MSLFWSQHFPQLHWGGHFGPDATVAADVITGTGPAGVATFALMLDESFTLNLAWATSLQKKYDGTEQRASVRDDPQVTYSGSAIITGSTLVGTRATLARYVATGATFLLGLPHEEIIATGAAVGQVVPVTSTTYADWCVAGQRVVVIHPNGTTSVDGVIQSSTSTSVSIYPAPASVSGARIMPAQAIVFEPQQGFARYRTPDGVERWQVRAHAVQLGTVTLGQRAVLLLAPPQTNSGNLDNAYYQAIDRGLAGNDIRVTQSADSLSGVTLIEDTTAMTVAIQYEGEVSTLDDLKTAINASELIEMLGSWVSSAVLATGDDEFAASPLDGGTENSYVTPGAGATVSTYRSSPWWDRGIAVTDTAADSIHAMTEVLDLGAVPFSVGETTDPDLGRQVSMVDSRTTEWQWLKRFLATVKGRFKGFWLSTMRPDLEYVSHVSGSLVVTTDYGDVTAWYPLLRTDIMVVQPEGGTCARITAVVDNGDGTTTLTVVDQYDVPVLFGTVTMICWLDFCHFESDELAVQFDGRLISFSAQARAVPG